MAAEVFVPEPITELNEPFRLGRAKAKTTKRITRVRMINRISCLNFKRRSLTFSKDFKNKIEEKSSFLILLRFRR
jgi:hypothetical protein